jgi:putative ATP-binding cassette transporter
MEKFYIYKDAEGKYRWRVRDDAGRVPRESGVGYEKKRECERNIRRIQKPPNYKYEVLRLMWVSFPWLTIGTAVTGIISGFASIAVVNTVNTAIHDVGRRPQLLIGFIALNFAAIFLRIGASLLPAYASMKITTSLRIALCKRILVTSLEEIERRGITNVLMLLINDVPRLTQTLLTLPMILIESSTFVFGVAYLAYLSRGVFSLTIVFMALGTFVYFTFLRRGISFTRKSRDEINVFIENAHALLFGIKELKLNGDRRRWFRRAGIEFSSKRLARYNFVETVWFTIGGSVQQVTFAILIGLLIFGVANFEILDPTKLAASVLAILYVLGPFGVLMGRIPRLGEATIACERLAGFGFSITDEAQLLDRKQPVVTRGVSIKAWRSIELQGIKIDYRSYSSPTEFQLGPIDIRLQPGELVFIVGGNGSGKSTLAKVVTALYSPLEGRILLDGRPVNDDNREAYQSLFATVFTDFHIFNRVIGPDQNAVNASAGQEYLATLGLAEKVKITGKKYSTTTALSNGQRKRLALLCAYLEDRPIYVFDEWAADQDPGFKKFFYEVLLPDFKSRGKCVIALTHDDQYFNWADRIVKLNEGRIVSDTVRRSIAFGSAD